MSMPNYLREILKKLPVQTMNSQASTKDQLEWLVAFANRLGLYDAADAIKDAVKRRNSRL